MALPFEFLKSTLGLATDAAATGDGSLIGIVKQLRTLLGGGLPASLGQKAKAASLPVTLASDEDGITASALPITTPTHTTVAVTTASGAALAANSDRLYALLVNDSDEVIYLKFGADAVANEGIRLNANGGSYEMSSAGGNLYTGAINAIHGGTGNKVLTVLEGV
jgi:hypothetical protein